jgi:hypothetical protein
MTVKGTAELPAGADVGDNEAALGAGLLVVEPPPPPLPPLLLLLPPQLIVARVSTTRNPVFNNLKIIGFPTFWLSMMVPDNAFKRFTSNGLFCLFCDSFI